MYLQRFPRTDSIVNCSYIYEGSSKLSHDLVVPAERLSWGLSVPCQSSQFEPSHDKTNKMTCAPSEDTDQTGHPRSLIRVFAYAQ